MTGFMVWRLVIDLGFLGSIIFFCFKYAKLSTLSQVESVVELEGSLRRLMQEAQVSGAQLSDVLVKRQTAIEKLMLDMQALEQRVKRLATAAELQATAPMNKVSVESEVKERSQSMQAAPAPLASQVVTEVTRESQPQPQLVTENHSGSASNTSATVQEQSAPAAAASPSAAKQYNIFGEEIISKPSTQPAPPPQLSALLSRLANKVEREVVPETPQPKKVAPYEEASSPAKDIQKVYSAAEELLKAGKEVEYVSFRTKLPVGDVQMLATMLEREKEVPSPEPISEVTAISDDPRLGVLGSIKRQVQTL